MHWVYEDEAREAKSLADAWDQAFQGALGPLPGLLHSPCCAEFVVSRSRILQRPLSFYVHLRSEPRLVPGHAAPWLPHQHHAMFLSTYDSPHFLGFKHLVPGHAASWLPHQHHAMFLSTCDSPHVPRSGMLAARWADGDPAMWIELSDHQQHITRHILELST